MVKNIDRSKNFPRYARKINSRLLRGLYVWPLHYWWPSDTLGSMFLLEAHAR